jgi:pilus assembly protein Flp/PilA
MTQLQNLVASIVIRLRNEEGQTMAEYGMLVALIAVAAIIGVTAFGGALQGFFSGLPGQLGL